MGAIAGGAVALVAAPVAQPMLFQVAARDPGSALAAAGLLLAVTLGAATLPSWRASRVNPVDVLRADG
jgi:ABC-type lipoprotein release transport system permease subunit